MVCLRSAVAYRRWLAADSTTLPCGDVGIWELQEGSRRVAIHPHCCKKASVAGVNDGRNRETPRTEAG